MTFQPQNLTGLDLREEIDRLRRELNLAVILITHDMGIVAQHADRLAVMYGGRIVETGPVADVFASPSHPYTKGLLASVPTLGDRWRHGQQRLNEIPGSVPTIMEDVPGCRFAPRCTYALPTCEAAPPVLRDLPSGTAAACIRAEELA